MRLTRAQARKLGLDLPPPKKRRIPQGRSKWEATLERDLRLAGLPAPIIEHPVVPDRGWRFDLAWPAGRLAVEVQGGTRWGRSRHSKGHGYRNDCRKLLAAQLAGWTVVYVTPEMIGSREAQELITSAYRQLEGE